MQGEDIVLEYTDILRGYLQERNEANLERLSQFGRKLADEGTGPERILAVHLEVMRRLMKDVPTIERPLLVALLFECLSKTLTGYGLSYRECMESMEGRTRRTQKVCHPRGAKK